MENNKLIAEFMGASVDIPQFIPNYNTSWDCLMPVIREVLITIDVEEFLWEEWFDSAELKSNMLDCDIDGAYKEVVELIKQIKTYLDGKH